MSHELVSTISMLQSLEPGDPVTVSGSHKAMLHEVHVTTPWHRRDGGGFGSAEHAAVVVGFGPGRWNVDVSAARIVEGYVTLIPGHGHSAEAIKNGASA